MGHIKCVMSKCLGYSTNLVVQKTKKIFFFCYGYKPSSVSIEVLELYCCPHCNKNGKDGKYGIM